ncbi:hypothetical protein [Rhodanobacter caeni]
MLEKAYMTDPAMTSKNIGLRRQTFISLSRKDGSPFTTCAGTTRVVSIYVRRAHPRFDDDLARRTTASARSFSFSVWPEMACG